MTRNAQIVLPGRPLTETVAFCREQLGMRLLTIQPADEPAVAVVEGHGVRLRLDAAHPGDPGLLRLESDRDEDFTAPNGTRIELRRTAAMRVPPPAGATTVVGAGGDADWTVGRAGMRYRDLVPGRLGGHLVASHIRIPDGGPVPDDVHFHDVSFQLIHCVAGWVQLVYEDQGAPFELRAGQTLLQPPQIRHRVLACSDRLEVVEVTSPAEHTTSLDHERTLPTERLDRARRFDRQRFFVGDLSATADVTDFEDATAGRAAAEVLTCAARAEALGADDAVDFVFVLRGEGQLTVGDATQPLPTHGAVALPPGSTARLAAGAAPLSALRVQLRVC